MLRLAKLTPLLRLGIIRWLWPYGRSWHLAGSNPGSRQPLTPNCHKKGTKKLKIIISSKDYKVPVMINFDSRH